MMKGEGYNMRRWKYKGRGKGGKEGVKERESRLRERGRKGKI